MRVPFTLEKGCISLAASRRGRPLRVHLDTGAGDFWILPRAARRLGRAEENGRVLLDGLRLGGRAFPAVSARVLDTDFLALRAGMRMDVIAGKDLLEPYLATIDFGRRVLTLARRPARPGPLGTSVRPGRPHDRYTVRLPFTLAGHLIVLAGRRRGRRVRVCLDTGSAAGTVSLASARRLGLAFAGRSFVYAADRRIEARECRIEGLKLGDLELPAATFFAHDYSHLGAREPFHLLLGADLLRAFRVQIDYRHRQVALSFEGAPAAE